MRHAAVTGLFALGLWAGALAHPTVWGAPREMLIPAGGYAVRGVVSALSPAGGAMTVTRPNGQIVTIPLDHATRVLIKGRPVTRRQLRVGATVTVQRSQGLERIQRPAHE
ncbi:MAG: hypothetical protein HYT90_05910 [Candidatus Omnitrophica bacterium]|nr:hypothetical protein [Candidatus Omnitrophota bacterium]